MVTIFLARYSIANSSCAQTQMRAYVNARARFELELGESIHLARILDNNAWLSKLNYVWSMNKSCI